MSDLQTLQTEFKQWLSSLKDQYDMSEDERTEATERLTALLNASGLGLPDHGVLPGQFTNDGQMHIECGTRDRWGNGKWEIVVWMDGVVDPTTYDLNLGGLYDPYCGSRIGAIVDNPQIVMDDLQKLITNYEQEVQWLKDNDDYNEHDIS
jgi:hypothetical protein